MARINRQYFDRYTLSDQQRIGNTILYLAQKIPNLSKTKLLKLIYILDEQCVKKTGIPFLGLTYEVWKNGPVNQDLFYLLSDKTKEIKEFVRFDHNGRYAYISPNKAFDDSEFSDRDIEVLNNLILTYGPLTADDLIEITHAKGGLWDKLASKHGLKEPFDKGFHKTSNHQINFKNLLDNDIKKQNYDGYLENKEIQLALDAL